MTGNILPANWSMQKLSACCEIVSGATPKRNIEKYWDGDIPWVTPKDLSKLDVPVLDCPPEFISKEGFNNCSAKLLPKGSVLFSSRAPIGLTAIAGRAMCTNQGFKSLVPGDAVDSGYLYHCMKWMAPKVAEMGNGATFKEVSKEVIGRVEIPLPPLPEQRRIAAILDKADAIRRKRQQAIRLTEEFLRSVFLDMFGDPVTNPKGWAVKEMGDLLEFLTSGSRGWAKYYKEDGRPFLRIQNVGENKILLDELAYVVPPESAEARRTKVKAGDVLLSITADLGRTGVVPDNLGEAHINQHLALMRLNQGVPLYISAFLASDGGQRQFSKSDKGGVKAGLNFDDIRSIKVLFPPLPEQKKWACFYKLQQAHTGTLKTCQGQVESLFNSLVQRAFRGDL